MKKILILVLSIGVISCSTDNEITQEKQETVIVNSLNNFSKPVDLVYNQEYADQLFSEYVKSPVYLVLKNERKNFVSKTARVEDLEYLKEIENEEEMFSWLSSNISFTGFLSLSEAIEQWNRIGELKMVEVRYFPQIYDFISNAPEELVVGNLEKWLGNNHIKGNNLTCEEKLASCETSAWSDYYRAVDKALKGENALDTLRMADESFDFKIGYCVSLYSDCIGAY